MIFTKIYDYEKVLFDYSILPDFNFGIGNSTCNEMQVIQRVLASNCVYTTFHGTFYCFHNLCSLRIFIPLFSINVTHDGKQMARWS